MSAYSYAAATRWPQRPTLRTYNRRYVTQPVPAAVEACTQRRNSAWYLMPTPLRGHAVHVVVLARVHGRARQHDGGARGEDDSRRQADSEEGEGAVVEVALPHARQRVGKHKVKSARRQRLRLEPQQP